MSFHKDETVRRINSCKYGLVLLAVFVLICKELVSSVQTLCTLSLISRHAAVIYPSVHDTEDKVNAVIIEHPNDTADREVMSFGVVPPNGHPWHRWESPSINTQYLIEELSIIDSLNKEWNETNLNTTFRLPHYKTLMPFVVRNGVAFHPKQKNNKRWKRFVNMLADALSLAKRLQHVPRIRAVANGSFPFLLSLSDVEKCNDYTGKEIPVFSWYTTTGCEFSWPVPYPQFCSAQKETETAWDDQFDKWRREYPWNSKLKKAIWRGSMTGPNIPDWRDLPRAKLALQSFNDKNRTIDAAFVEHNWRERTQREEEARNAQLEVPRMEFYDFMKYRAILDVDGNAWSGRFGILLCFDSVVIKVESQDGYKSYYELDEIRPWEHFIPVNSNMSDLDAAVAFAVSDENQAKVQTIIKNAQSWCRSKLTKDQLADDLLWTLVSYVEMLNKNGSDWHDRWMENTRAYNLPEMDMQEIATA